MRYAPLALATLLPAGLLLWAAGQATPPASLALYAQAGLFAGLAAPLCAWMICRMLNAPYEDMALERIRANTLELARLAAPRPDAASIRLFLDCHGDELADAGDAARTRLLITMLAERLHAIPAIRPWYDVYAAFNHLIEEQPRHTDAYDRAYRTAMAAVWEGASPYDRDWPVHLDDRHTMTIRIASDA